MFVTVVIRVARFFKVLPVHHGCRGSGGLNVLGLEVGWGNSVRQVHTEEVFMFFHTASRSHARFQPAPVQWVHMGGYQNYGPFRESNYYTTPNIQGTQKETIILATTHIFGACPQLLLCGLSNSFWPHGMARKLQDLTFNILLLSLNLPRSSCVSMIASECGVYRDLPAETKEHEGV